MTELQKELKNLSDEKYEKFQGALLPTVDKQTLLGVAVPKLRTVMKKMLKNGKAEAFLSDLPHATYEENMLHSLLLSQLKDYDSVIADIESFLPYVDNWAVCDSLRPKCVKNNLPDFLKIIQKWILSEHTYTIRFGMEMLMIHFLSPDYFDKVLYLPLSANNSDYYVKLMVSWFYATALTKNWEKTLSVLTKNELPLFEHNKTLQKACESLMLSDEKKAYLQTLIRKK